MAPPNTQRSSVKFVTAIAFALVVSVVMIANYLLPETESELSGAFAKDGDRAWIVQIPSYFWFADSMSNPAVSPLRLYEDGKPIGKAHCEHVEIRESGGGCYSHWVRRLIFSTPDNSDPLTNGRTYSIGYSYSDLLSVPALSYGVVIGLTGFVCLLSLVWAWHRKTLSAWVRRLGWVSCVAAIALTTVNLSGYAFGPSVYAHLADRTDDLEDAQTVAISDIRELDRRPSEPADAYVSRVTHSVYQHMADKWGQSIDQPLRVPLLENYILFGLSILAPGRFGYYEYQNLARALSRGTKVCSQLSLIVYRTLERNGITASVVGLDGHVVARVLAVFGK